MGMSENIDEAIDDLEREINRVVLKERMDEIDRLELEQYRRDNA